MAKERPRRIRPRVIASALSPLLLLMLGLGSALLSACAKDRAPVDYRYEVVEVRPHDTRLFTQGLLIHKGLFYESGGRYRQSRLVAYDEHATDPVRELRLPPHYFAEGLTELGGQLYLLTWKENTLLTFDKDSFELLEETHYPGEGWGLTDDNEHLIRSDGSDQLYFHEPQGFGITRTLSVRENGQAVARLNELEFIEGTLWANIWHSNRVVQIDPSSGQVIGSIDLSAVVRRENPSGSEAVLNGIAYDEEHQHFWVTGKSWRHLYRIELQPEP
ncbi:glutaminyl-peptide cyclotransferase [Marinimicrobium agarilyticum]|uniref:glutaminyl-peptide cyclotransferase n=1 Tax=Marinimicrobium agarilyticum TaxID=306546 RepID=UPI0004045049|nr:glutaminyl-peptide cyclotransferase [Marinimicrobium agarilyticum]